MSNKSPRSLKYGNGVVVEFGSGPWLVVRFEGNLHLPGSKCSNVCTGPLSKKCFAYGNPTNSQFGCQRCVSL